MKTFAASTSTASGIWRSPKRVLPERDPAVLDADLSWAAAHILWELGEYQETLSFITSAGLLEARLQPDHRITLSLPSDDPRPIPIGPGGSEIANR
ncbi:hypothetical protein [Mycobacterium paraffinicum]|uniref:hypothetical protein n=1 Tax=Mycobacterium paraffinicum TaxID=53378 RepID=UPI001FC914C7|nr:hypothetical protein [Mycobacterium paraffinicum]